MAKPDASATGADLAVYDGSAFFEKALLFGVRHGVIDQPRLDAIARDAPKGMVQIARYFGSEFLRPELERSRQRLINLVSLSLRESSGGDLALAAQQLREQSLLSRSKAGADLLKAMLAMPQNSHFGMHEQGDLAQEQLGQLARWSLRSWEEYRAELTLRSQVALLLDAAIWLATYLGLTARELEESARDAEAVIRTALLVLALKGSSMPDWVAFETMVAALRRKTAGAALAMPLPKSLPERLRATVQGLRQSVLADLPKIRDSKLSARKLFDQTPAFMGRYFWREDALAELDHHARASSAVWRKATSDHSDEGSLLTLFLCIAAQVPRKTLLTEKSAVSLLRKISKSGLQPELASQFIDHHAPESNVGDYQQLWQAFVDEAAVLLGSDRHGAQKDALALLRRECHVCADKA